jgi:hypothetical protein
LLVCDEVCVVSTTYPLQENRVKCFVLMAGMYSPGAAHK